MSEPPTPKPERQAPIALWQAAHALLAALFSLFGAPEELAARHTLTFKDYKLILPWLRAAEALVRRMLFIEAALAPLGPQALARPRLGNQRRSRGKRLLGFDAEHPEQWRVSFRSLPGRGDLSAEARRAKAEAGSSRSVRRPGNVKGFRSAWPLAERMEALLRVFNDPAPFAKRLAQRLRKTPALTKRFTASWSEHRDLVGHLVHDALDPSLECARAVFAADTG